jgi:LysR family transcriptional regulator for metE and metH
MSILREFGSFDEICSCSIIRARLSPAEEGPMDLDVRHLRLVAGIADAGSMTKAAVHLHLTQSALSHQLRDIESRFRTPFFLRLGKRMVLTAAGRRLLESARRVLDDLERTEEDLRRLAGGRDGVIRVCTQCNTGYHWLAPLLATFTRRHPRVTVNVVAEATDRPVQALLDGRLDLAILTGEADDRRLRVRPLFTDEMVAIVSLTHPFAGRSWLNPRELASQHLLLYSSSPEESFMLRSVLGPLRLVPARVSFIMLTEAMIEMARAGLGVGVLPRWSAQAAIAARAVIPLSITRAGIRRQWSAATVASQAEPAYLTEFIDLIAARALPARTVGKRAMT